MSVYDSDLGKRRLKPLPDISCFRAYSNVEKEDYQIMTHMINEDVEVSPTVINVSGVNYTMTRISLPCLVTESQGSYFNGDGVYCVGIFTNNETGNTAASTIPYEILYELLSHVVYTLEILKVNSPQDEITEWILQNTDDGSEDYIIKESTLKGIANAIRAKNGTSEAIATENMASAIKISLPQKISNEADMTALLETAEIGEMYKYVGESGTYENGAIYIVEEETQ